VWGGIVVSVAENGKWWVALDIKSGLCHQMDTIQSTQVLFEEHCRRVQGFTAEREID